MRQSDKCPISNTRLCLRRNAVYQLTCNSCDQQYIGSTTRVIHDRVREHLNNENSSVKKHIYSWQNKEYKGIDVKIIMSQNDPANLPLYETFHIRKCKPTLNSREECTELADLLFQYLILETIGKRFQRSFAQRHSIIRALYSIHSLFLQFSYIRHIFYTFHLTLSLHIYSARNIFSSLMMPLIGESLDFSFYFLNSSLRSH